MTHTPVNHPLVPGIYRLSRSQAYAKKALFKKPKSVAPKASSEESTTKTVTVGGKANGSTRIVSLIKAPKFYPADDIPVPKKSRKSPKIASARASITPGTILIILSGRFRGKRVVFLKQLESGLLLVTGPHKVNGVPLRRVNQAYVIATSAKIDISKVNVDAKLNDSYFKVPKEAKKKATAAELFGENAIKKVVDAGRVTDQKAMDAQLLPLIKKTPLLKAYLNASFSLSKGQYPHAIKF